MVTGFSKRRWAWFFPLLLVILAIILGLTILWYSAFLDRYVRGRWTAERQEFLAAFGEKILAYAHEHDNQLPQSLQEVIDLGLLPSIEVGLMEPGGNIRIAHQFRPLPTTNLPKGLVIMIERYDPSPGILGSKFNVLMLDGTVHACEDVAEILKRDNQTRRVNGLTVLPYEPEEGRKGVKSGRE